MKLNKVLNEKVFQIVVIAAIYFLLFAHPVVFNIVDKGFEMVGLNIGDTALTVVHSLVFAIFFFYSVQFVLKNI